MANHDKGAVDDVNGTVKYAVFCHVQSVINSPQQFAEYAGKLLEYVSAIYILTESLQQLYDQCRQKSVCEHGILKVPYVDWFVSTDSVVMKFYKTTISKQPIQEIKYFMQGQDDDANFLEDDHAPRSTSEKVEFQVDNYCLVNYEEKLWPGQITKIISSSLIQVKCYKKATAPAGSTYRWPKKTDELDYNIMDIKYKKMYIHPSKILLYGFLN